MIAEKQTKTDLGKIKIHTEAISSIASIATTGIKGVLRIYKSPIFRLADFLGPDAGHKSVKVTLRENNEVDINVPIVVEYGQDVPHVANMVQENIRQAIEKMTGLVPMEINIKVKGVEKVQG